MHDFTIKTVQTKQTEEIKSKSIRELVKTIKYNTEVEDHKVTKTLDIIGRIINFSILQ